MTKNEIINEIKSVVMNNGGEVKHGQIIYFINEDGDVMVDHSTRRGKNINYESKAQLEADLDVVKMLVEKYCNTEAKTVETKVENTENTVETKPNATKKDIVMGLHENGSVECDLETAQSIEKEGFIKIESYEGGLLRGDVCYNKILDVMFDEYDCAFIEVSHKKWAMSLDDIYTVTKLYDKGYINNLDYDGDDIWHCRVRLTNVLSDFCKRWGIKLSEVA